MKTILITGCSTGFGLETARTFLDRGWRVVATMRKPDPSVLPASDTLRILALDVTDENSIRAAVAEAGPVDALVNNAGIGLLSVFEATPADTVRDVLDTNVIGTMLMTQAVLPQMRARKAGVIVNVTSSVTFAPIPLLSVYTASKAAVAAFSDVLALELAAVGVQVRTVLPGRSPTAFGATARTRMPAAVPPEYEGIMASMMTRMTAQNVDGTTPLDVAEAVWRAVTDPQAPMHTPAGADAVALATA